MKTMPKHLATRTLIHAAAALALLLGLAGATTADQATPQKVDLRDQQTPIVNQGQRGTCVAFAVVAAMEAAYKRAGYGDLNLSEEFAHDVAAMMYLIPPDGTGPNQQTEDGVSVNGGGHAGILMHMLTHGLAVPEARFMPYRLKDYAVSGNPDWKNQYVAGSFNLDPLHLPVGALHADRYFSIQAFTILRDPTDTKAIERVLQQGHEVVWNFTVAGDRSGPVWKYTGPPGPNDGGHATLIVGYDRTDPARPYFILKNSWGKTNIAGANGFTYVAYDYLNYGTLAAYIQAVAKPGPRPGFAFLGRWSASFPGHKGLLDLYRVPGVLQWQFQELQRKNAKGQIIQDRRVGTFYEDGDASRAYRVNGTLQGSKLLLTIDWSRPNLPYDQLGGYQVALTAPKQDANRLEGALVGANGPNAAATARRLYSPEAFEDRPPSAETLAGLPELALRSAVRRVSGKDSPW
jgi:hypothetical protein